MTKSPLLSPPEPSPPPSTPSSWVSSWLTTRSVTPVLSWPRLEEKKDGVDLPWRSFNPADAIVQLATVQKSHYVVVAPYNPLYQEELTKLSST